MPITNIFATWSLGGGGGGEGGGEEEPVVEAANPVPPTSVAVTSPFVKPREHTGITPSFFKPTVHETAVKAGNEPPSKIQKVLQTDKGQKEDLMVMASNLMQPPPPPHKKPPVPQQIFIVNNETSSTFPNNRELEDLSDDNEEDGDGLSLSSSKSANGIKEESRALLPAPFYRYRDHSQILDDDPLLPLTPFSKIPNFPAKLHAILSRQDLADIISWMPHGRSWRVLKPRDFEIRVLPSYFEHQKLSSFIRQANGWGFHRISQGLDRNSYYHELFLRGLPHLCKKMKRPGVNRKPVVDPDHEPDFSAISEMHPLPIPQPEKIQDEWHLHSTLTGGPKKTMKVPVNKDELRSAISQALATSNPTATELPKIVGDFNTLINMKPPETTPKIPSGIASNFLFPSTLYHNTTLSGMRQINTIQPSSLPPSLDPLSHLLFLLKSQPSTAVTQLDTYSTLNTGHHDMQSLFFHSLLEQQEKLRLLNAAHPTLSATDAVSHFAAGFAAATALHQRQISHGNVTQPTITTTTTATTAPQYSFTSSLELDAAAAMSLLEDGCRKNPC